MPINWNLFVENEQGVLGMGSIEPGKFTSYIFPENPFLLAACSTDDRSARIYAFGEETAANFNVGDQEIVDEILTKHPSRIIGLGNAMLVGFMLEDGRRAQITFHHNCMN